MLSSKVEQHHEIVERIIGGIRDAMEDECFWAVDELLDRLHQFILPYRIVNPASARSRLATWEAEEATLIEEYTDQMLYYRINSGLWVQDDGGRESAGYLGKAEDCVIRAISIAMKKSYADVWGFFNRISGSNPDNGVSEIHACDYIKDAGWTLKYFGPAEAKVIDVIPEKGSALIWCGFLRDLHCTATIDGTVRDDWNSLGLEVIWIATPPIS